MTAILGRRRARKTLDINTDGIELLARQLASPDPTLRLLAAETRACHNTHNFQRVVGGLMKGEQIADNAE